MKLGIMQPYFFPYLGHFALIDAVDQWVVFDVTQYKPKTWMNRNRILHPSSGWQYITVPLSNSSISIKTSDAKVLDIAKAKNSIVGKLSHYKKKAPFFFQVNKLVKQAFDNVSNDSLVNLNVSALSVVCEYLDIPFNYQICSELKLDYPKDTGPGEWAPFISGALGASQYINPLSGGELFNTADFQQHNVELILSDFTLNPYDTGSYDFEPGLSILDVMMWNSPEQIKGMLKHSSHLVRA